MADLLPQLPILKDEITSPSQLTVLSSNHDGYTASDYFVSIDELAEQYSMDTTRAILLLIPLYAKLSQKSDDTKYFNKNGKSVANFEKLIFWADPLAPAGDNIVVLLIGNGHNEELWSGCLKQRDNGQICEFRDIIGVNCSFFY